MWVGYIDDLGAALKVVVWGYSVPYDYKLLPTPGEQLEKEITEVLRGFSTFDRNNKLLTFSPLGAAHKLIKLGYCKAKLDKYPYVVQRVISSPIIKGKQSTYGNIFIVDKVTDIKEEEVDE